MPNCHGKARSSGFVAVFVGRTSGIGEATVRALAAHGEKFTVYIVGRNKTVAEAIINLCQDSSLEPTVIFIQKDVSLLKNVDLACEEIKSQEQRVDLLFMSHSHRKFLLTSPYDKETFEGIDTAYQCGTILECALQLTSSHYSPHRPVRVSFQSLHQVVES